MTTGAKTLQQIYATPVLLLTAEEIERLDPQSRVWARRAQEMKARHNACPQHERIAISDKNGWHAGRCKHCGMDMSYDGD